MRRSRFGLAIVLYPANANLPMMAETASPSTFIASSNASTATFKFSWFF
jgi:hypothetical protein